jgi:hypothetical protein
MRKIRVLVVIGLLAPFVLGCGRNDGLTDIGGAIVFEGTPIENGMIRFLAADGNSPTAAAAIKEGKYVVKVSSGKKQVQIEAFKVVGQRYHRNDPRGQKLDVLQQMLPERYNAKSDLTCEVQPGKRVYDFTLTK